MTNKTFEIDWPLPVKEGEEPKIEKKKVTIKKLTYGQKNELNDKLIQFRMVGNRMDIKVSIAAMTEHSMLMALVEAPFDINIGAIRNLDPDVGEKINKENEEFNNLTALKKARFAGLSSTEHKTQNSSES